ncbi:MAG: glycoside hydrolase family 95-like protein [Lentisphaerota bacterium]
MNENSHQFSLDFPLERTHCGIVMGNGNLGAVVWGRERLHITVNRSDFWDHRGGELIIPGTTYKGLVEVAQTQGCGWQLLKAIPRYTFPGNVFKPQRLPAGRFEFSFSTGIRPVSAALEYESGTVTVKLSDGSRLELDLGLNEPVLLLRDDARAIAGIEIKPAWDFPQSREWLEKYGFVPPERFKQTDSTGWAQSCPADPSLAFACVKRKNGYAIALEPGEDNALALWGVGKILSEFDENKLLDRNRAWWSNYWTDAPEINLPDEWFNRFFKYALYKFAAATHPDGYACGLQGPWIEEYQNAQWSGDYHFNVNVQQIYSPAFATGKLEHLLPLFDMIESEPFQAALKHNAKVMFGIDDALWFTHAVDDLGQQCGWLVPGSVLDPACGAWTAQLYWQYYKYSGDREFLKNRALPFIRSIMRGYEAMLEEYEGRLSIPLAISAEYGCSNPEAGEAGRDPSYQLACIHMLADMLLETSEILGFDPKPVWLEIKQRVPEYTLTGKPGNEHIAIWEGQDLDVCHRHHSHLACIYPFDTLKNISPEQQHIIDNSIDHWILKGMGQWSEWCYPWAAIIQARLGFKDAPVMLLNIWKEIFINEGWATVYLPKFRGLSAHRRNDMLKPKETTEIMQLDGTMAGATAILEMLVHEKQGVVHVFPAVPDAWLDISFNNIRLPGAFQISAERKNGKLISLNIKSLKGGKLKLIHDSQSSPCAIDFKPGEEKKFFDAGKKKLCLELVPA